MAEPERERATEVHAGLETSRSKGGKGKAIIKRSKGDTSSRSQPEQVAKGRLPDREPESVRSRTAESQDPQVIAKIQQRAYRLFEARGFEHGHDLEHWLEAERQITGSSER